MQSSLKILAINWRDPLHPEAGGVEVHLDKILTHLSKNHDVVLISTRIKKNESLHYHGYKIYRIGHPFLFHLTFKYLWNKLLKKRTFDIIIDDISKIPLQTPKYIKNIPIIAIFHHLHGRTLYKLVSFPLVALYIQIVEKRSLKAYQNTSIVVVSQSSYDDLTKIANYKHITILPNGIDESYLYFKEKPKNPYQICSVGRLRKAKRIDLALDVFSYVLKKYPCATFFIAGKGDYEQQLKNYAKKLNIDNSVIFLGFISEEEKKILLSSSMAMLFTSEKEGWGIVALESSACETPVFGYKVPGIVDSIKEGVNGYLVDFPNVQDLGFVLSKYLSSSFISQKKIQHSARCFAKNFIWARITHEFELIILNEVLK